MPISSHFSSIHQQSWTVSFLQCGPNQKIRYTDLCHLLQLTAHEHSVLGGLSFQDMQVFDQAWVLSNMYIEIESLPKWEDTIVIKTWIVSMQDAHSVRALEVWHNDKKIAGALTLWVVLNTKLRKTEKLALSFDHFQFFPEKLPTEKALERVQIFREYDLHFKQTVKTSDLDLVHHVNNVKYLEWCLDTMPIDDLSMHQLSHIHLNYLREMHHNQNFTISQKKTETAYFFSIATEKNCCLVHLTFKT